MLENLLRRLNDLLEICCHGYSGKKNKTKKNLVKKEQLTLTLKNKKDMWKKGHSFWKGKKQKSKI